VRSIEGDPSDDRRLAFQGAVYFHESADPNHSLSLWRVRERVDE
jgi:hypothetical protein